MVERTENTLLPVTLTVRQWSLLHAAVRLSQRKLAESSPKSDALIAALSVVDAELHQQLWADAINAALSERPDG